MSVPADPNLPLLRAAQLRPSAPDLARVLEATREGAQEALAHILLEGDPPPRREQQPVLRSAPLGQEYLMFTCGSMRCAAPLTTLREVLPGLPPFVRLPFSPPWMLGIFALRSEMLGLVDPLPMLLGDRPTNAGAFRLDDTACTSGLSPETTTALVLGEGERSLALAISGIGEIFTLNEDTPPSPSERREPGGEALSLIKPEYLLGLHAPSAHTAPCALLHTTRLLDDLLQALEGRAYTREG